MRYVGCKRRLLPFIHQIMIDNDIAGDTFCDLFAGTATVGKYFKQLGYQVISCDLLYLSFIMQQVKVAINQMPSFTGVIKHLGLADYGAQYNVQNILDYLNNLEGIDGFVYRNYSEEGTKNTEIARRYYIEYNAKKIDVIRESIEVWHQLNIIIQDELYILLYALLNEASRCANTTGMMSSFLKHYAKQSLQQVQLQVPDITASDLEHQVHCGNSIDLIEQIAPVDILYLDPPYTKAQYAASYHLLETIARWDAPKLYGISGKRDTTMLHSPLNRKREALAAIKQIVASQKYRHLLMSYSDDSIIPHASVMQLLEQYGDVICCEQPLKRYNSMAIDDPRVNLRTSVKERLYYLKPHHSHVQLPNTRASYLSSERIH